MMTEVTRTCFVCGEELESTNRVAVTGHIPPSAGNDATIRLHDRCVTHLTAEILRALHASVHTGRPARAGRSLQSRASERFGLTPGERRVLTLLVTGDSNKEIAGSLGVTEKTVKNVVSTVLAKLGVRSRTEAAVLTIRMGLLE